MNSTERIRALLNGEDVDQTPVAGWQHNSLIDRDPEKMIRGTIQFTEENGWDVVKIMSQPQYMAEALGDLIEFPVDDPTRLCGITKRFTIDSAESLAALEPVTMENPVFIREVQAARGIVSHYQKEKVVIPTFFTPLSWLKLITSPIERVNGLDYSSYTVPTVSDYLSSHREELKKGLDAIHESNLRLADAMLEAGCDGFFYSTQYTTSDLISEEDFERFEAPYIRDFLEYVKGRTWFNVLHVHGTKNLMFEKLWDCPVEAINWEDHAFGVPDELRTSITTVRQHTDKIIMAGIDRFDDLTFSDDLDQIRERLRSKYVSACEEVGSKNFIFTPGCGILSNRGVKKEAIALIQKVRMM